MTTPTNNFYTAGEIIMDGLHDIINDMDLTIKNAASITKYTAIYIANCLEIFKKNLARLEKLIKKMEIEDALVTIGERILILEKVESVLGQISPSSPQFLNKPVDM